jgi:hypothetical protein
LIADFDVVQIRFLCKRRICKQGQYKEKHSRSTRNGGIAFEQSTTLPLGWTVCHWSPPDGSRAFAQKDMGRTLARNVLRAFVAQSTHIDVIQEMLPGTE